MNSSRELPANEIDATILAATLGQPMHHVYAALGYPKCPTCDNKMNAVGYAEWTAEKIVRNQWRCVTKLCADSNTIFNRTTRIVETPPTLDSVLNGSEPVSAMMIGIYKSPRARKFDTLFVRRDVPENVVGEKGEARPWELWWSNTHLVGFFTWEVVSQMLRAIDPAKLDIRVNHRITR